MGLKHPHKPHCDSPPSFQTNPCGIEANSRKWGWSISDCFRRTLVGLKPDRIGSERGLPVFQTNPCGIEARAELSGWNVCPGGFRRTLVGLKHVPRQGRYPARGPFQTNPCGIEASRASRSRRRAIRFRRTLVGLKHIVFFEGLRQLHPVSDEPLWD